MQKRQCLFRSRHTAAHSVFRMCNIQCQTRGALLWQASGLQGHPEVMGLSPNRPPLPSFLSSIFLSYCIPSLSFPISPSSSHASLSAFSASLPSCLLWRPLSNPPCSAKKHPVSHKSSLEPSQGATAASCNRAKSERNHTERTEPQRQLAQAEK